MTLPAAHRAALMRKMASFFAWQLRRWCTCKERKRGQCVPCAMAARIRAGEKVSEVFRDYE